MSPNILHYLLLPPFIVKSTVSSFVVVVVTVSSFVYFTREIICLQNFCFFFYHVLVMNISPSEQCYLCGIFSFIGVSGGLLAKVLVPV